MRTVKVLCVLFLAAVVAVAGCRREEPVEKEPPPEAKTDINMAREEAISRGVKFLLANQKEDGSFEDDLGITGLCLKALAVSGEVPKDDPAIQKSVEYILKFQEPDGGIYDKVVANYTTCIGLMALLSIDAEKYADEIKNAAEYIIKDQWDDGEEHHLQSAWHGGWGYGEHERPDLSNVQFAMDALREADVPRSHPVWQKAIVFVSRTQARSESNEGFFVGTDDGGFIYTPHRRGESKAGYVTLADGRKCLKSYGSMTYAGFKSFAYADLARDDPRVLAALGWIKKHWTVEENPGMEQQGLYYYYMTMAKALAAWGDETITDDAGFEHDWRKEITEALLARQDKDGSWVNPEDRWFEGYKPLVTAYSILALNKCRGLAGPDEEVPATPE